MNAKYLSLFVALLLFAPLATSAIVITPNADTTLFENDPTNNLGRADLTSGSTAAPLRSRALIKFDIASALPSNAVIASVRLTLTATKQPLGGTSSTYRLFRVLQPWNEGNKTGTHGAPAEPGETTWNDRFASKPGGAWTVPGASSPKDFSTASSSSVMIDGQGPFTFLSTSNLVSDVRFWLSNPTNNYGWIVISDSESIPQTVTHFGSREDPPNAPALAIEFTIPLSDQSPRFDRFSLSSNIFTFGFTLPAQKSVIVQYAESVVATNWQTLTNFPARPVLAEILLSDPIRNSRRFYRTAEASLRTNLVYIPPGAFSMGSPTNEVDRFGVEGPQTAVTISRGFWIGRSEVTQREYLAVIGTNPSHFTGDPSLPVEQVNWSDATNYCAQLTQQERAAGLIGTNDVYRLPTEAEWEYACRAGTSTRFAFGDDPGYTNLTKFAWYADNATGMTHPIGQKLPNPWGLDDMYGNVLNWCQDWWGPYRGGTATDPQGPSSGTTRVIRGGSWLRIASHCRSAFRHNFDPQTRNILIGFRVVLTKGG